MIRYLATFHTHLSALLSCQNLQKAGCTARMMPVPRALSSSCGTCVKYTVPDGRDDCRSVLDSDLEALYLEEAGMFRLIFQNEI